MWSNPSDQDSSTDRRLPFSMPTTLQALAHAYGQKSSDPICSGKRLGLEEEYRRDRERHTSERETKIEKIRRVM
jgi:hypothetical protein